MMTREEALHALGLDINVAVLDIERALVERVARVEQRLANAPTEALRDKYGRQLAELEEAHRALLQGPAAGDLSRTMIGDLPLADASYTQDASSPAEHAGLTLVPGHVLAGRYELKAQIGSGGMGAVYSARDRNRDKDIAIKVLLPRMLVSPKARERFLREARLASELSHPGIATVFDVQQDGVHCFLTMELLRGQSLRAYLKAMKEARRDVAVDKALDIVDHICAALAYAHERTVHRDLKPENVWLGDDGKVKVMDFGIALLVGAAQPAETAMDLGTPYYMAPEQVAGASAIDARADQYSVAVVLYEMLTGRLPTGRIEPLRKLRRDVPSTVSQAVDKALAPSPSGRYPNIRAFREALSGTRMTFATATSGRAAAIVGVLALVAVATIAGYPYARSMLAEHEAAALAPQEAARLQGETRSLLRLVENQRRELKEILASAVRDVERLEGQQRSGKSADESAVHQAALLEAREKAASLAEIDRRMREQMDGPAGLTAIEGTTSSAEAALKNEQHAEAIARFAEAVEALHRLRALPDGLTRELRDRRAEHMGRLAGRWSLESCEVASQWTLRGDTLVVHWPAQEPVEERIVAVDGSEVVAVVRAPASQRGRLYRYAMTAESLHVEDLTTARRALLRRCAS